VKKLKKVENEDGLIEWMDDDSATVRKETKKLQQIEQEFAGTCLYYC
jgi:hypothetical protein